MSPDIELHWSWNGLKKVLWRDTRYEGVQWYYAEERLYVLRVRAGQPNEHYLLIKARSPEDAIRRAIYNMQTADEINGTKGERRFPSVRCGRSNKKGKTMPELLQYIRCHIVKAIDMTRGDYNKYRGWEMPQNENRDDEGYLVVYPDGYESWCPKAAFEKASRPTPNGLPFGYAIMQCRYNRKRIKRKGWNGIDQYVEFRCVNIEYGEEGKSVTSEAFVFHGRNIHTGETNVQVGWLASQADMAADDWVIVE